MESRMQSERNTLRIAIPCFGEEVAPCFEAAHRFRAWTIENGEVSHYQELEIEDSAEALDRVRRLERLATNVLICNGIGTSYAAFLSGKGCDVVSGVVGPAQDALFGYLVGCYQAATGSFSGRPHSHTADLVSWSTELFARLGWTIRHDVSPYIYPIDFAVVRNCPVCLKPIRAAICCGAHAYRIEDELKEFARVTAGSYHTRVYIHQAHSGLASTCRDYRIELLDPNTFSSFQNESHPPEGVPPLRDAVAGHDQLLSTTSEARTS
jgi:predicted Fe-Mo cluster-binding NifX family protein